jgi:hypothetical protein
VAGEAGILGWGTQWLRLAERARDILSFSDNMRKCFRITARYCRLCMGLRWGVDSCGEDLKGEDFKALQYLVKAPASVLALRAGKLQSLGAKEEKGDVFVIGRLQPDDLQAILGLSRLRVMMPSERLARLVVLGCHEEDHRQDVRDCVARSRRLCWIIRARALDKVGISAYLVCRRERKRMEEQVMGMMPSFR